MINNPLVTVVIPTFNSSSTLKTCLGSLAAQTYKNIEVIVVDNCSTDRSVEIAKDLGSTVLSIRELRSAARNIGWTKAHGAYVLFIDADMELSPRVIEECVLGASTTLADAIMIPEIRIGDGFWANCRAVERLTYIGDPLIESARFFKKSVLQNVGGYDENLEAGEDWDLHARVEQAGYKQGHIASVIMHHEGHLVLKKLLRKRYYYAKTLPKYIKKHPDKSRVQFMPVRLNFIKNWRVLAHQPLYSSGMFLMKMLEYQITVIAMISVMLSKRTEE